MAQNNSNPVGAISLPKGGGAIKGIGETFQPNLFTGTGNFSIPIATSPGRNGFEPKLGLQYSTGQGNGLFGLGWQLTIPSISRKTEKGIPQYKDDTEDVFVMSGAEDLVPYPSAPPRTNATGYKITCYRPRTEGLFARIEKWESEPGGDIHWRATTRDNVTSIYGRTPEARVFDPAEPAHVFEWLLQETFDAKGNHILYEYAVEVPSSSAHNYIYEQNRSYCQRYPRRIFSGTIIARP